jgi:hypothetical protein
LKKKNIFSYFRTSRLPPEEADEVLRSVFGDKNDYSRYFNWVGVTYRTAGFVFLVVFLVYLIVTSLGNLTGITYANAEYVVRNFAVRLEDNREAASAMIYNPDGAMRFAEAGGGLAVCGNTGVTIFSATGRRTCRDTAEMFIPAMRASKKYTAAYDSGGKKYYIYNSFTRVFTGETEYPVYGMSVADNGYFLLITGSDLSASSVVLYDSDFNPVAVLGQSMHTAAAELDREGRRFAVVSEGITEDGRFSSFVRIFNVGEKDPAGSFEAEGAFALGLRFCGERIFCLFSDRMILSGPDGSVEKEFSFGDATPVLASSSDDGAAVLLRDGEGNETLCFWSSSGSDTRVRVPSGTASLSVGGSTAFILHPDGVRIFRDGVLSGPFTTGRAVNEGDALVACSDGSVYCCGRSAAYLFTVPEGVSGTDQ